MKRAAPAVLLIALIACTPSRVKPEADIAIAGSVLHADGSPATNRKVSLVREGDAGDVLIAVTTLGLACLSTGQEPAICDRARTTTSGGDGRFDYRVKGRDTQSTFGTSAVLALESSLAAKELEVAGSSLTYRFHAQTEALNIPLRFWEPVLGARTGSFGARVTFPRAPTGLLPAEMRRAFIEYTIAFSRGSEQIWRIEDAESGRRFDPRVLEDSTGSMLVIAGVGSADVPDALGDEVAIAMRSGARAYASPLVAPPSRDRPCSVPDGAGRPVVQAPCRLTDGEFEKEFRPTVCTDGGCTEPPHRSATIDLGANGPVDVIVVRGCPIPCRVETSSDASRWRLAAHVTDEDQAAITPAKGTRARYVRLTGAVDRVTEVSVWRGSPRVPNASLLVAPARFPTGANGGNGSPSPAAVAPNDGDENQGVWPLVATGLIGAVAGGLVVALVRRRASSRMPRAG